MTDEQDIMPPSMLRRVRAERVQRLLAQEQQAHETLDETGRSFEDSYGLPAEQHLPVLQVTMQILQDARRKRALPPLADPAALLARCPEVFTALARGAPLEPLIQQCLLRLSNTTSHHSYTQSINKRRWHPHGRKIDHNVLLREWVPPGRNTSIVATLDAFEAAHPVQREWVRAAKELANQRSFRYVGVCVDREPYWRLEEDGTMAAAANATSTSRLLNFMREVAPMDQWRTYTICGVQVEVRHPTAMPVEVMLQSCGWRDLADRMQDEVQPWTPLTLNLSRTMILKKANAEVAPIEAALIHCSSMGSATLNSASSEVSTRSPLRSWCPLLSEASAWRSGG